MRQFHKPVRRASDILEELQGDGDPADVSMAAHDTAAMIVLLAKDEDPDIRARVAGHLDSEGIEGLLELWKNAAPVSLPGALLKLHRIEQLFPEGPVAEDVRALLGGKFDGDFSNLCARAAILGRRLGPRWDAWAAELEACVAQWRAGSLW